MRDLRWRTSKSPRIYIPARKVLSFVDSSDQCSLMFIEAHSFARRRRNWINRINQKDPLSFPFLWHDVDLQRRFAWDGIKQTSGSVFYFHNRSAVSPRSSPNRYLRYKQSCDRCTKGLCPQACSSWINDPRYILSWYLVLPIISIVIAFRQDTTFMTMSVQSITIKRLTYNLLNKIIIIIILLNLR